MKASGFLRNTIARTKKIATCPYTSLHVLGHHNSTSSKQLCNKMNCLESKHITFIIVTLSRRELHRAVVQKKRVEFIKKNKKRSLDFNPSKFTLASYHHGPS